MSLSNNMRNRLKFACYKLKNKKANHTDQYPH